MGTEVLEQQDMVDKFTEIIPHNKLIETLNLYLGEEGLNLKKDDYCYIRIVGNHLELGRVKIEIEE